MPDLTNAQIAAAFDELGDLYELDGAVSYRVIAYRNAARAVRDASVSVAALAREGKVTELPGIGKTLEEKLRALDETGDIPAAQKLRAKFPVGLISVAQLPNFGPKRARRLYDELGIDSLEALRTAAEAGQIRGLKGFGAKVEENLKRVLAEHEEGGGPAPRVLLNRALPVAEQIVGALRAHPGVDRVEVAGSLRRLAEAVKDIDIIITAHEPDAVAATVRELPLVESVHSSGDAGARVTTHSGMRVDLKIVEPDQFGNVLQHFTGSKAHNVALREAAVRKGLHVSEYGILDDATGRDAALRDRGGGLRAARAGVDPAGAARGPRRARGGAPGGNAPAADHARGPARRPALPHDHLRRAPDRRGDGRGGARERHGVPGDHRPLGLARLRRPRHARGARGAHRRDPRAQRAPRRDRAADRDGDQHPHRRLARLLGRAAGAPGLGDRLRAHVVLDGRARDDRPHGGGDRASRGSTPSATRPDARSRRGRPTRSTWSA